MANEAPIPPDAFVAADWARNRNDAGITAEIVMSELAEDHRSRLQNTQRKLQGQSTTAERYRNADGRDYSVERRKLHEKIIGHFLSEKQVSAATPDENEAPVFVMLGGRGGSGKSRFKNKVYNPAHCIVLDADEIKNMLPEYEGWNAAVVHEESSDILDVILRICRELKINVVLDATMKTGENVLRKADEFKSSGYRVEAHYMHLPRKLAAIRAVKRFCDQDNGRYVPVEVILDNKSNESNFDELRRQLDAWSFWDNDVPDGSLPTYVSGEGTCALMS